MRNVPILVSVALLTTGNLAFSYGDTPEANEPEITNVDVVQASDVEWTHLNPKRGDLAPKAGTLWGDRNGKGPTGFLLRPADGFESPPHIHNVSYRGVVISGLIHNDDPDAAEMWMPAGSFWTQPKGEVHITAAKTDDTLAYIEIEGGPYLVRAAAEAFDSGERPVNIHPTNIVWLNASDLTRIQRSEMTESVDDAKLAFLWGSTQPDQLNGTLLKLPVGYSGKISSPGPSFRAVVIQGALQYRGKDHPDPKTLSPGSYVGAAGKSVHEVKSVADTECLIYIRTVGTYHVVSTTK